MFGIDDKYVWMAYLLCLLSSALCVAYGLINWNRGDEAVEESDVRWVAQEQKAKQDV